MAKYGNKILLFVSILIFFVVNILTLKNGHNWGDDFSQYILQAKNIITFQSPTHGLILNAWVVPPFGFPLLLAPLVKIFGINFWILKTVNIVFWLVFSYFLFLISKRRLKPGHSDLLFVFFLSSPFFFCFKQSILSDIPFMAFFMAAIYVGTQYLEAEPKKENRRFPWFFLMLSLMAAAFFVRNAGVVLFLGAIFYLGFIKKERRLVLIVLGVLFVSYVLSLIYGTSPEAQIMVISKNVLTPVDLIKRIYSLTAYHLSSLVMILVPRAISVAGILLVQHMNIFVLPFLLLIIIPFVIKVKNNQRDFMGLVFILYFLGLIFWPVVDGMRYVLPIVGFVAIFIVENCYAVLQKKCFLERKGGRWSADNIVSGFLIAMIFFNIVSIVQKFDFNDDAIYRPGSVQLIQAMKSSMKNDEVFMASRARALSLLTGRQGVKLQYDTAHPEVFCRLIRDYKVEYFIRIKSQWRLSQKWDPENVVEWYADVFRFPPIWENDYFMMFKITEQKYKR
jgi:hypothetical protein